MKGLAFIYTSITLACMISGTSLCAGSESSDDTMQQMRNRFTNPVDDDRGLPMCSFDYTKIVEQVKKIRDGGWGGVNAQWPNWDATYLENPEGWRKFRDAVDECRKNNLPMWIYDERAYPSGKAGTLVLKGHPEFEAQGLYYASSDYTLASSKDITWKLPEGEPYYIALFKLENNTLAGKPVDLTLKAHEGTIETTIKPGNWRIVAFMKTPLYKGTHSDFIGERYVNLMNPDATDRFLDVTHEAYFKHAGKDFGSTIKAFFTDEPSLMGGYLTENLPGYPALAWWDGLPAAFKSAYKYDIKQALPSIFNNTGKDTVRKRCDVYRVISDLTAQNFFGRIQQWCKEHNVASAGHMVWEESLIYHANFYGNILTSLAFLDIPGIDVLGCNYGNTSGSATEGGPVTPKLISSSAHVYDRERTCSESFCFVTKEVPLESMIAHVAWQWVLGINTLTTLSTQEAHSPDIHRKLNDYTGKLSYMLTQGKFKADVAVLYPIASVWADFSPTNRHVSNLDDNPKAKVVDDAWQAVTRELLACQRDFDYLDESNIRAAKISDGSIKIGKCDYSILVLPNVNTLTLSTLKQIERFVDAGGTVISCGDVPSRREDAGGIAEFARIADRIWGSGSDEANVFKLTAVDDLRRTLEKIGDADVRLSKKNADIYYQHRSLPKGDIYFLLNNAEKGAQTICTFRASGKAEVWDPMSGEMKPVTGDAVSCGTSISLEIPGRNGIFVIFSR